MADTDETKKHSIPPFSFLVESLEDMPVVDNPQLADGTVDIKMTHAMVTELFKRLGNKLMADPSLFITFRLRGKL